MQTVLGLSMTPTNMGLVLVEGDGPGGTTTEHDAFEVRRGGFSPVTTSEYVAQALSRTRAIADGQRLRSIGVTWSDDASVEASLLLDSLAAAGFDNVVPIRLPEATEAFARQIGGVIGTDVTAVCVVTPEAVVLLIVDAAGEGVQTAVSCDLQTEQDLCEWLSDVLGGANRHPAALVLLGSGDQFDTIARELEDVLGVPVFAPAEGELALARGAALASVSGWVQGSDFFDVSGRPAERAPAARGISWARTGPLAMLAGGVVTLVVALSALVGYELLPDRAPAPRSDTAEAPAAPPIAVPPVTRMPAPAPPPSPEAVPEAIAVPEVAPEPVAESATPEQPVAPEPVSEAPPQQPPVEAAAPPVVTEPTVPPVPGAKPPLLTRILGHLPGLHGETPPAG